MMPAGRPRTVSKSPEEMIELGKEMVTWVSINKPIHLSMWYTMEKDITDEEWDTYRKRPEFVHYYEKALKLVGYQYLDKESRIRDGISQRWQRVYFKDLKAQEDADAVFAESIKTSVNTDDRALEAISKVMDYVSKAQSDKSDLTSNNTDNIS